MGNSELYRIPKGGKDFLWGMPPCPPPLPAMEWRQCPDLCFTHPEQVQGVENQEGGVEDKSAQKCPQHHVRPAVQSQQYQGVFRATLCVVLTHPLQRFVQGFVLWEGGVGGGE